MSGIIHDFVRYNARVQHDFSTRLNEGLSAAQRRLIESVSDESAARGLPLYAVGGLPRDLWLRSKATDLDLVVEGDAIALARALSSRYGGKVTVHPKFGTAKWDLRATSFEVDFESPAPATHGHAGQFLDLVSARTETYRHPVALPTVKRGTIEDDIRRRDFTINTLALRLDGPHRGELRDELGALEDLRGGVIRVLHPRSFVDDPTRMYRAARYEQRFGFRIANDTLRLMPAGRRFVADLSGQRIRHELDLILDEGEAASILSRLAKLGLLQAVHSALPAARSVLARVRLASRAPAEPMRFWSRKDAGWLLWLMGLGEAEIRSLSKRLHFTSPALRELHAAAELEAAIGSLVRLPPSRIAAQLDQYPELAVYVVSRAASGSQRRILDQYLVNWRHIRPVTTGHDLKAMGLSPGPVYRTVLGKLRADWIDGRIRNSDQERDRLRDLLEHSSGKVVTKAQSRPH